MQESEALSKLVITDTIPNIETGGVKVLTIAPMFSEAIRRINHNESISILFE
jgi:ribose-phosphate pyrophosphokinase